MNTIRLVRLRFTLPLIILSCINFGDVLAQLPTNHVWVHPGAMNTKAELDFVKAKIATKANPWYTVFNNMVRDFATPYTNTSAPQDQNGGTENAMKQDAKQCYANALAWYHTGNTAYGDNAIKILNTWANTFNGYSATQGQSQLDCAWIGSLFGPAAEIMRGYSAWTPTQQTAVVTMFKTKFYPALNENPVWTNGNIDLTMCDALLNLATFCEDVPTFNAGLKKLTGRIPAYFYVSTDPASALNYEGTSIADWYNPTKWVDGLTQETCRDGDHHAQFAMSSALHAAEVLYHQGVDVYTPNSTRFVAVLELMALQVQTQNMQGTCSGAATTDLYDTWEVGYNHYANRKGMALPNTWSLLTSGRNVRANGNSDWNIFYETLTHDLDGLPQGQPTCSTSAPVVTNTTINYSIGDTPAQLTATGDSLKWYTVAYAGTPTTIAPTPSTTIAGTTTYYVSQTQKGCESIRTGITVNVINLLTIQETNTTITIDGLPNETAWTGNMYEQSINNPIVGTVTNAADLSGRFKALWDANNLYLFATITDNIEINNNCAALYNDDALELYLDLGNTKTATYGANDFLFTFRWSNPSVTVGNLVAGPNNATPSIAGINYAFSGGSANGPGYTFELSIPWALLNANPAINQLMGFDLHVNDDDAGACTRKSKLSWNASADQAWTNPTYFGTATFTGIPTITSLQAENDNQTIKNFCYPNPFTESITLNSTGDYFLYDLSGELFEKGNCDGNCQVANNVSVGVYILEIQRNGRSQRLKIIKK